ncbi:MAG: ATP-dependent helicase HrpB [Spongiibacteraceae bacterium]
MSELPILQVLPVLAEALATGDRVVLEAPPGAGKSTFLPLWLLERNATPTRRVVLIQPRRLAAASVAGYLARQLGESLGERVGLRTRFDRKVSAATIVEVVTEGIFLRQIQGDPTLAGVGWVLFDEYHERSWQADLGLAFALETQGVWREAGMPLQIIVMSATLPAATIAGWLDAPVVRAEGRSFPVKIRYSPTPNSASDRSGGLDHAAREITQAIAEGARKVLVFLPGWSAIARLSERLSIPANVEVFTLHSQVAAEQQQQALLLPAPGRAAVVLATNIAETSLTIEGVDVVIDSGEVRRASYDPARGMDRLQTGWISRASATQRSGRAGRLGPGRCVRLWSREQQGRLAEHDVAEIHHVDLAPLALELALWGGGIELLPEVPPAQRLRDAQTLLVELDALDNHGRITASGRQLAGLGVHPRLGHLLQLGQAAGATEQSALLAALLSEGDFVRADAGRAASADLDWRLQLLQSRNPAAPVRHGVVQRIRQLAAQLSRRSDGNSGDKKVASASIGLDALLYAAFPDRLARQREPGSARYLTVDGFEIQLDLHDALRQSPWLIVAEHDGARQGARVRLALALSAASAEALIAGRVEAGDEVYWDEARGGIFARRRRRIGAIVIDERATAVDETQAQVFWLTLLRERGLDWLQLADAAMAWLARARWSSIYRGDADGWADFSEAALLASAEQWFLPYVAGVRRLSELRAVDWLGALQALLDYGQRQRLDQLAPARFLLPSGHTHAIDYSAEVAPRLAARVQEFYGLNQHPSIADGRQPLLIELLSPAHRPVQLTQDLPGFWRSSYSEVRKELKGRYPKHFWPDEPWAAAATTVTKNRMRDA